MKRRGVVMTGLGVICSGGNDCASFAQTLAQGTSALSRLTDRRVEHYGTMYAGLVPDEACGNSPFVNEDRYIRFAERAMGEAIVQARVDIGACGPRAGLFLGTCSGPMLTIEQTYGPDGEGGPAYDRTLLQKKQYYRAAYLLARRYRVGGPVYTTTTACSAFCAALAAAADLVRIGILDVALVGGADSFSLTTLTGFIGLKAVSSSRCAPFSLPSGLNLGEGAAVVVLEEPGFARKRAAPIIGVVEGYGLSNDAFHCSAPDPTGKGAAAAMNGALRDAGAATKDISYINAHGTGTEANDKAETKAIKKLFGEDADITPVSSTKAVVGHCLGAAGAIETVASLLCAQKGFLPPTVNYTGRREGCSLDYIAEKGRPWKAGQRWLKNNFAFGGNNASIVLKNGEPDSGLVCGAGCLDEPIAISAAGIVSAAGVAPLEPTDSYFHITTDLHEREIPFHGLWPVREVPPFNSAAIDRRCSTRGMDRAGMLASAAAALALKGGRIADRPAARSATGFFMNIAQGSSWAEREHIGPLLKNRFHIEQIHTFPYIVPNAVTGTVARALSLTGYNNTFCNGPGAGLLGLIAAWAAIKNGHVSALLCGSVDDLTERGLYDCVASEPGGERYPVLGEGAVMLLLEPQSMAAARGIEPLGTIIDCAFTTTDTDAAESDDKVRATVAALFSRHGIDSGQTLMLCSTGCQERVTVALKSLCRNVVQIDQTPVTGWMPAGQPLFDTVAALVRGKVGNQESTKYILTILCSPEGKITIVLLKKNIARKSGLLYD
jgi:3-oxoacyl-[acyl-carrier-protein] synthase II